LREEPEVLLAIVGTMMNLYTADSRAADTLIIVIIAKLE